MLGRADVARERMARMMAAANASNPYEVAFSGIFAALLRLGMREYEQGRGLGSAGARAGGKTSISAGRQHIPDVLSVRRGRS